MKQYISLMTLVGPLLSAAQASIVDLDNLPVSGYTTYFPSGENLRVLS